MAEGEQGIGGAIRAVGGDASHYAVYYAEVADVAGTCRRAEAAGATVLTPPVSAPSGLVHARLLDPTGNQFGVFSPPPAR
ncbi:VOC family protein [Micromonospora sp. NPDC051925]|uniref:VOC family protein n=1 Tax=Micromonospora sp. NPDC051925 TaxID=3364288 RepID=UPI0037C82975